MVYVTLRPRSLPYTQDVAWLLLHLTEKGNVIMYRNQIFSMVGEQQMGYNIEKKWFRRTDGSTLIPIDTSGQPYQSLSRLITYNLAIDTRLSRRRLNTTESWL